MGRRRTVARVGNAFSSSIPRSRAGSARRWLAARALGALAGTGCGGLRGGGAFGAFDRGGLGAGLGWSASQLFDPALTRGLRSPLARCARPRGACGNGVWRAPGRLAPSARSFGAVSGRGFGWSASQLFDPALARGLRSPVARCARPGGACGNGVWRAPGRWRLRRVRSGRSRGGALGGVRLSSSTPRLRAGIRSPLARCARPRGACGNEVRRTPGRRRLRRVWAGQPWVWARPSCGPPPAPSPG